MTHRERMLAAFRGEPVDRAPWVPRLDLWHNAHAYRGTLPGEWDGASLADVCDGLGIGLHAIVPNFLDTEDPDEVYDRLLGIEHVANQPFRLRFRRTRRLVERDGDNTRVTYRTPVGSVSGVLRYDERMRSDGITIMAVTERVVKTLEDYDIVAALFEDIEVVPDESRFLAFRDEVGERGLAVGFANVAASPVHQLLKELVPYDRFYFNLHDHPQVIERAARRLEGYFEALLEACLGSSAEALLFGANYDVMITPPSIVEEHILPTLTHWADAFHAHGKLLATHTDGENDGLCELFVQSGTDIADSVCPAPMTRMTLQDYREAFGSEVAIWGGICSTSVLESSFTDEQFEQHIDEALAAVGDGRGLVFSIADTAPPEASLDRIRYIGERLADHRLPQQES